MSNSKPAPSVSLIYADNGSSAKRNELIRLAMQKRAYAKRRLVVMGQKVNTR